MANNGAKRKNNANMKTVTQAGGMLWLASTLDTC